MKLEKKAWYEKYNVSVPEGDIEDIFRIPGHVYYVGASSKEGIVGYFVGFDGTKKTWEQLTDEEKKDFEEQINEATEKLLGRRNTEKAKKDEDPER